MNIASNQELIELAQQKEAEASQAGLGAFAQSFHLMPPAGWLNDPNGLCQVDGVYHFYFQYAPASPLGALKYWGHCTSTDMLHFKYEGVALAPDAEFDRNGVYSGNALVEDGKIRFYYTGNAKKHDRDDYDYVNAGREANTVYVESADGYSFGPKRLLMTNDDYPSDLTCHVRDPFVWRTAEGSYLMLQGARRKVDGPTRPTRFPAAHGEGACRDWGEVLVFRSADGLDWKLANRLRGAERFGFMWECPGFVRFEDGTQFLSVSPQGLEEEQWTRGNIYQAGYFPFKGSLTGNYELGEFRLWDAGFDFYAPQIFITEDGRQVLVGWMGMPDEPAYGNDPTVEAGWQHCFTVPRELSEGPEGIVLQKPIRELEALRSEAVSAAGILHVAEPSSAYEVEVTKISTGFRALINRELLVSLVPATGELPQRLELRFISGDRTSAGCGRKLRWEPVDALSNVRIVVDTSSVEVFANDGATVFSTRMYPRCHALSVEAEGADIAFYKLAME